MRLQVQLCVFGMSTVMLFAMMSAQTTTGTITGRVFDAQRSPLPGVTVAVESPNLQGSLTVTTSSNGDYIIGLLPPGTYTLSFRLPSFESQQQVVELAPTATLPLDITLGPATLHESVEVVGRSADVLTRTAQVATDFDARLIALWPTNRDLNAYVQHAPNVHPTGPSGAFSFSGAMSYESLYLMNGVTINENLRGQANPLYIEDAIQEAVIATDGVSAEYGRFNGGVVNIVTKSGGNLFSGSFRDTLYNDNWRAYVTGNDAHPFAGDAKVDSIVPQYEYVFGGPAIKDRLWFFNAGRFVTQQFSRSTAQLNIPYVAENDRKRYEIKVTGSVTSQHRIDAAWTKESLDQINNAFQLGVSTMDLASLYNNSAPQHLFTVGYNGVFSPTLFVEARFSIRHSASIGSGSAYTDLVKGTLLTDVRTGFRYWSPTFCGVCDPEDRDNDNQYVKATYFKSTETRGAHNIVFGYDTFNDKRFANNHQSGSDYRIIGTTTLVRGSGVNQVIYPVFLPESTIIQANPLSSGTLGTNFRSHGLFVNDHLRWNGHVTFNLGLRWDRNHGVDSAGSLIANEGAISPRVGVIWDPRGDGVWSVSGSWAKYTSALNNSIADSQSAAGNPATFQWPYQGPAINADESAPLLSPDQAIPIVFEWFNAGGGLNRPNPSVALVPGFSIKIPHSLDSPGVWAYAAGISRQFAGGRGVFRADYSYRNYVNFYAQRIDLATGTVRDARAGQADLAVIENTNAVTRRYSGLTLSATHRPRARVDIGANYTLSHLWGNFDGEIGTGGPVTTDLISYPEYRRASWYAPEGDLSADQRHRATIWANYSVPHVSGLTLSALADLATGVPYGAVGRVDARNYVTNPGYAQPQGAASEVYYYTARDAFRTEASRRVDFAANYRYRVNVWSRMAELFLQAQVLNVFNTQDLCGCGADVFTNGGSVFLSRIGSGVNTAVNNSTLAPFNPFTETPVLGVNWMYHPNFGTPANRFAYTSPRSFRLSFGVRF